MVTIKYGNSAVGIDEIYTENSSANVVAYPNPSSNGRFTLVDASGKSPISGGRVFDSSGRLVGALNLVSQEADLSGFPAGLYLLQYDRENLPAGSVKLMVE